MVRNPLLRTGVLGIGCVVVVSASVAAMAYSICNLWR
jgi:hypothetical protein